MELFVCLAYKLIICLSTSKDNTLFSFSFCFKLMVEAPVKCQCNALLR